MKILSQLNRLIRSTLYVVIFMIIIIPYSFLCLAALALPLRVRTGMVFHWTAAMLWLLKITCRIDHTIEGLENIPKDRTGIILSKHQSTWETFLIPTLFHQTAIIIKRELLWLPFFGWGLLAVEPIAINRSEKSSALEQILRKGKECLDKGRWILIFPEGTRTAYGSVGHYRLGGPRLATTTGAPIIPIAHNAGKYWPKKKFLKRPGTIKVVIGPPIETKGRAPEEVLAEVKNWIESTVKKIDTAM